MTDLQSPSVLSSRWPGPSAARDLEEHYAQVRPLHLRQLFRDDSARGARMAVEACGFYLDYSKNRLVDRTLELLLKLAEQSNLGAKIEAMFQGEKIN